MTTRICSTQLLAAALLVVSGAAGAWTAYDGAPPYGYGPQGVPDAATRGQPWTQGYGPAQSPPYPMPPMDPYGFPGAPGVQPMPEGPQGAQGPTYPEAPGFGQMSPTGGLGLRQEMTDEAYILVIDLDGQDPDQIDVSARGNALLITRGETGQTSSSEQFDDGHGYARSWSWSSGRSSRRLPVPPDGDLSLMRREQDDKQIRIIIPRRQVQGGDAQ